MSQEFEKKIHQTFIVYLFGTSRFCFLWFSSISQMVFERCFRKLKIQASDGFEGQFLENHLRPTNPTRYHSMLFKKIKVSSYPERDWRHICGTKNKTDVFRHFANK